MAERIRNFFRFNILPVLPYLRKKNRGTAVNLCILILFLFAMNTAQIVHEASKIIEADAAEGEEVHLICRNTTWEQADALRRTAKTFSKRRDGSFRIEYIRQSPRLYDKRYNVGLRFIRDREKRYHGDLIVTYNSFMQNYSDFLLEEEGVTIELTPLYFTEANYTWDTFRYHVSDALGFHAGDTVLTVLDTEVPYFVKTPLGLDPSRLSEATVHFAHVFFLVLLLGAAAVTGIILLELRAYRHDFAVFSVFGADYKRLILYLQYKTALFALFSQIPAAFLSFVVGILIYGRIGLRVPPGIYPGSAVISFLLVLVLTAVILKYQTTRPVIRRLTDENNESWILSPRKGHIFGDPGRFLPEYTFIGLKRFAKFYGALALLSAVAAFGMNGVSRLNIPAESLPEFVMTFGDGMDVETYEDELASELLSVGMIPSASLCEMTADTGVFLELDGRPVFCEFRSAGLALYRDHPEAEEVIQSGRAFVLADRDAPAEIILAVPRQRKGGNMLPPSEKEALKYSRENYTYEETRLDAAFREGESDAATVWLPLAQYRDLFGIRTGILSERHIRMAEGYAAEGDSLMFVPYRSRLCTDDFSLRCVTDTTPGGMIDGDFDKVFAEGFVAVRANSETVAGLHAGDEIELSSIGRERAGSKDTAVPSSLSAKLTKYSYDYETLTVCAVVEDRSSAGLELLVSPSLYERLTGIPMVLTECRIDADEEIAEDPKTEDALERIASAYYETYFKHNHTSRTGRIAAQFRRSVEAVILKICILGVFLLIGAQSLILFDEKRSVERAVLWAYGGTGKQVRLLMTGAHAVGVFGCLGVYCLIRLIG